jgi:hypothetical protein
MKDRLPLVENLKSERPETITQRFIRHWQERTREPIDPNRLRAELVSVAQETNRRPDTYYFVVSKNGLIDPETGQPILNFIAPGIEYNIAKNLQDWAIQEESGTAYWVSPKLDKVYPCNKLIIHEIVKGDAYKKVLNTAILFDGEINDPEILRNTLVTNLNSYEDLEQLIDFVVRTANNNADSISLQKSAEYYAEQILSGADPADVVRQMKINGFIGDNAISCPNMQLYGSYVSGKSEVFVVSAESKYVKSCGACGASIEKYISRGYKCSRCGGTYEGC